MRQDLEEMFEKIAETFSAVLATVECSPAEYREGLGMAIELLQLDKRASEESER